MYQAAQELKRQLGNGSSLLRQGQVTSKTKQIHLTAPAAVRNGGETGRGERGVAVSGDVGSRNGGQCEGRRTVSEPRGGVSVTLDEGSRSRIRRSAVSVTQLEVIGLFCHRSLLP